MDAQRIAYDASRLLQHTRPERAKQLGCTPRPSAPRPSPLSPPLFSSPLPSCCLGLCGSSRTSKKSLTEGPSFGRSHNGDSTLRVFCCTPDPRAPNSGCSPRPSAPRPSPLFPPLFSSPLPSCCWGPCGSFRIPKSLIEGPSFGRSHNGGEHGICTSPPRAKARV